MRTIVFERLSGVDELAGIFEHVHCSEFLTDETHQDHPPGDQGMRAGRHLRARALQRVPDGRDQIHRDHRPRTRPGSSRSSTRRSRQARSRRQRRGSALTTWKRTKKDEAGRKALRQKAQGEAAEAEKLAKELGVWDDPFGSGKGKGKPARGSKATSDAKGAKTSKGGKSKAKADDGDDAFSGLAALIQRKNQNRVSQFDDVIAKLEAKAGVKEKRPERRRV